MQFNQSFILYRMEDVTTKQPWMLLLLLLLLLPCLSMQIWQVIPFIQLASVSEYWIVDSGATDHMTSHKKWLFDICLDDSPSRVVHLPNGTQCSVLHMGSCHIYPHLILREVLLVPDFQYNLAVVSRLTKYSSCHVIIYAYKVIIQALSNGRWHSGLTIKIKDCIPWCIDPPSAISLFRFVLQPRMDKRINCYGIIVLVTIVLCQEKDPVYLIVRFALWLN